MNNDTLQNPKSIFVKLNSSTIQKYDYNVILLALKVIKMFQIRICNYQKVNEKRLLIKQ